MTGQRGGPAEFLRQRGATGGLLVRAAALVAAVISHYRTPRNPGTDDTVLRLAARYEDFIIGYGEDVPPEGGASP